jgi:nitroreductase
LLARLTRGFPPLAFLVGLSSVYWRETWKYGERAFRYCQHDAGHAIGTLRIAAAALGWSARVLDGMADATVGALLGLDRAADFDGAERENAELLMALWPGDAGTTTLNLEEDAVRELARQRWYGTANRLSPEEPVPWEIIDTVSAASRKP